MEPEKVGFDTDNMNLAMPLLVRHKKRTSSPVKSSEGLAEKLYKSSLRTTSVPYHRLREKTLEVACLCTQRKMEALT